MGQLRREYFILLTSVCTVTMKRKESRKPRRLYRGVNGTEGSKALKSLHMTQGVPPVPCRWENSIHLKLARGSFMRTTVFQKSSLVQS